MKKFALVFLVLVMVCTLLAVSPRGVAATCMDCTPPPPPPPPPTPKVVVEVWEWSGDGVTGEEIPMYTITTVPAEWYRVKANGIEVDGPTTICHPFKAGRFGWVGEIHQLVEGVWIKLPTTVGWVPNEEGRYMACAQAPTAGIYALFGYYVKK
jgi:hypothetical protein